jgi:hypothetical protein
MAVSPRVSVHRYVLETLMRDLVYHDRRPSAFLVYLHLVGRTTGRAPLQVSLGDIALATGLSKRGVQDAVALLRRRELIGVSRRRSTDVPSYSVRTPWIRSRPRRAVRRSSLAT